MFRRFFLLTLAVALVPLVGCGKKLHPVTGSVTLDGKAVAGASVTFHAEDGGFIASGITDDSGNFTLSSNAGPGAYAGGYKVVVAKYPKVEGSSPGISEGGTDKNYVNQMKKEMDKSKGEAPKMPMGMKGGMMPPPGMMPGGGQSTSGVKSELPEVYAAIEKTPLKVTVPAEGVKLELKSK